MQNPGQISVQINTQSANIKYGQLVIQFTYSGATPVIFNARLNNDTGQLFTDIDSDWALGADVTSKVTIDLTTFLYGGNNNLVAGQGKLTIDSGGLAPLDSIDVNYSGDVYPWFAIYLNYSYTDSVYEIVSVRSNSSGVNAISASFSSTGTNTNFVSATSSSSGGGGGGGGFSGDTATEIGRRNLKRFQAAIAQRRYLEQIARDPTLLANPHLESLVADILVSVINKSSGSTWANQLLDQISMQRSSLRSAVNELMRRSDLLLGKNASTLSTLDQKVTSIVASLPKVSQKRRLSENIDPNEVKSLLLQ